MNPTPATHVAQTGYPVAISPVSSPSMMRKGAALLPMKLQTAAGENNNNKPWATSLPSPAPDHMGAMTKEEPAMPTRQIMVPNLSAQILERARNVVRTALERQSVKTSDAIRALETLSGVIDKDDPRYADLVTPHCQAINKHMETSVEFNRALDLLTNLLPDEDATMRYVDDGNEDDDENNDELYDDDDDDDDDEFDDHAYAHALSSPPPPYNAATTMIPAPDSAKHDEKDEKLSHDPNSEVEMPADLPLLRFDYHRELSVHRRLDNGDYVDVSGRKIKEFYKNVRDYIMDVEEIMARDGLDLDKYYPQVLRICLTCVQRSEFRRHAEISHKTLKVPGWSWSKNVVPALCRLYDSKHRSQQFLSLIQRLHYHETDVLVDYTDYFYDMAHRAGIDREKGCGDMFIESLKANEYVYREFLREFQVGEPNFHQARAFARRLPVHLVNQGFQNQNQDEGEGYSRVMKSAPRDRSTNKLRTHPYQRPPPLNKASHHQDKHSMAQQEELVVNEKGNPVHFRFPEEPEDIDRVTNESNAREDRVRANNPSMTRVRITHCTHCWRRLPAGFDIHRHLPYCDMRFARIRRYTRQQSHND
ncbi:hypothetical protein BC940DRAFT_304626 [Gongronella butleri]|nr:hypothetical protein BC940DRAFT_304626 [Gongronella butleri]